MQASPIQIKILQIELLDTKAYNDKRALST
jgi:hypothetical protein